MNTEWFLRSLIASGLVGFAALGLDFGFRALGRPRRRIWSIAMAASIGLALVSAISPRAIPDPGILRWISSAGINSRPEISTVSDGSDASAPSPSGVSVLILDQLGREPGLAGLRQATDTFLPFLWALLSLGLLGSFGGAWIRAAHARRGWIATELDGVPVLLSDHWGPAVIGVRKPAIVIPRGVANAPASEWRLILAHEKQHIAAGDSRRLVWAALMVATMPINPVLWWMRHRLHEAVETDCDARVVTAGADLRHYTEVLLNVAACRTASEPTLSVALAARPSLLERRLDMMTRTRPNRPTLIVAPMACVAFGFVLVACDVVAPESSGISDAVVPRVDGAVAVQTAEPTQTIPAGTVTGIVVDLATGEPLAHAQVFVEGTGVGTLTGSDGRYSLNRLPSGTHTISVARAGYRTDRQPAVAIAIDGTVAMTHGLSETAADAGTFIITRTSSELQPPTSPQHLRPDPVQTLTGEPSFTPYIVAPEIRNWAEVANAIRGGTEGTGRLVAWVYVDERGGVRNTRIIESSGVDQLDEVVAASFTQLAQFSPAMNRDQPVPQWVNMPIRVDLR